MGLTSEDAQARMVAGGPNLLRPKKATDTLALLFGQFKSPIILVLLLAAILSMFLHDTADALIILGIVLASGVLNIYPPEHARLAEEVLARGALLSEAPPHAEPLSGAFPQRNRLISGLSLGVIVVEAGDRSGALITARHAMEQGREVFAVPGRVDSRTSRGCHRLIRDGAKLVESADDVLEELGPLVETAPRGDDGREIRHPAELTLNPLEQQVLSAVGTEPTSIDQVVASSGLPVPQVLSTISVLEMRRLVRRLSGTMVARM